MDVKDFSNSTNLEVCCLVQNCYQQLDATKGDKVLPINFDSVVVNNIFRAAAKGNDSHILPFPNLIYRLLTDQGYQPRKGVELDREELFMAFEKTLH